MFFANFTPHHDIHGWKATDLSFDLAPSDRNLKHPTSRQNFGDAPGQTPKLILTLCLITLIACLKICFIADKRWVWWQWLWWFQWIINGVGMIRTIAIASMNIPIPWSPNPAPVEVQLCHFEFWPSPKSATVCQDRNTAKFVAGAKLTHGRD